VAEFRECGYSAAMGEARRVCAVATAAVGILLTAASAHASFPGTNGKIAFAHYVPDVGYHIYSMNADGSGVTPLTDGDGSDLRPAYSADGERIVFSRRLAGASRSQIWAMNADGSGQMALTTNPALDEDDPQFSPDGGGIVFERIVAGRPQVFMMNADGSGATQLTFAGPENASALDPSFSPDATQIVFARRTSGPQSEIWIMNADGNDQRPVTSATANTADLSPSFSPDGLRIAFDHAVLGTPNDENVYVVNADGSGLTQLTSGPGQDLEPVFSPDGTKIAVDRQDQTYSQRSDIVTAGSTGLDQDVTPLTESPNGVYDSTPDWQPLNAPACTVAGNPGGQSLKQVTFNVSCDENATVTADGSGQAPKVPRGAAASKKKKFAMGPTTVQVPASGQTTVTLTIPKKGRKLLKRATKAGKKGRATITVAATDDLGQSSNQSFGVRFKPKKKKK
jgi:Tol biopolymer transport system component